MTNHNDDILLSSVNSADLLYLLDEISARTDQKSLELTMAVKKELMRRQNRGLNNRQI